MNDAASNDALRPPRQSPQSDHHGDRDHPPSPAFRSAVPRELGHASRARFWDAAIVRVHTDLGVTGFGSGDMMLGFAGHEHLFVGQDALAIERHWRILNNISFHWGRCWPLDLALWDLAGKITGQPCWKLLGGLSNTRERLCLVGHAARPRGARGRGRALSRAGLRGAENPLPSRRLARRHQGAGGGARARRRQARVDGRLQSGLAHVVGRLRAVVAEGRDAGRARAGAARRLLDGGAAASRRSRGHARACATGSTCASPAAR